MRPEWLKDLLLSINKQQEIKQDGSFAKNHMRTGRVYKTMGRKPNAINKNWIVFGAQDTGGKSLLAYRNKSGMYAIKILQNEDSCKCGFVEKANTEDNVIQEEIEGEYTTLCFAAKNGIKSIDVFIDMLQKVRAQMIGDAHSLSIASLSDENVNKASVAEAMNIPKYDTDKKKSAPARPTDIFIRDR